MTRLFGKRESLILIPLFIVSHLLIGCFDASEMGSTNLDKHLTGPKIKLEHVQSIGDGDSLSVSQLLLFPSRVALSLTSDTLFVADLKSMTIKAFANSGKYLFEVGSAGQGPNEFLSFQGLAVSSEGELVVVDGRNNRITKFKFGNSPSKVSFEKPFHGDAELLVLPDRVITVNYDWKLDSDQDAILKTYSKDFSVVETSLASYSEVVGDTRPEASSYTTYNLGSLAKTSDGFVYAPGLYDGKIFKFGFEEDGSINNFQIIGKKLSSSNLTAVGGDHNSSNSDFLIRTQGKSWGALIHSSDRGFAVTKNGSIVHFYQVDKNDKRVIIAELFNSSGELMSTTELLSSENNSSGVGSVPWIVGGYDAKTEHLYVLVRRPVPKIEKYRMTIE